MKFWRWEHLAYDCISTENPVQWRSKQSKTETCAVRRKACEIQIMENIVFNAKEFSFIRRNNLRILNKGII